ncbi:uncharacterized protein A1O5_08633 [Cladophialophora psammophila CBS 110553]|uniref:MmgE/PrpD family protein n=1 Tax=Cladophialophora psammophila CBS 110553 TaxID=1182543 RepID=W9WJC9_9EURO|nr:uncharacterized protein A1O5_08633 [Cladophialophora psammophila CBS 110553]EXJ68018.1 hypothetical protein A1O5_08633 [Cladophialophora psammophila CBS 110553]
MGSLGTNDMKSMVERPSLLRFAASRLRRISEGQFSTEVREKATLCLLDWLGAAQVGAPNPLGRKVLEFATLHAGKAEAYVFGADMAMCAETAALTNAILAHSGARDDMHLDSCSHMSSMVVAATLALAQRDHWSGDQLLRGIIGGYEMGALLGTSIRANGTFNTHLRASELIGAFAAAGAVVAATFCNEETTTNALALAVNMACGINEWAWSGGREIFIHNGIASRGKDGFFRALGAGDAAADVFRSWDRESEIGPGILDVQFKPAPVCNFTQTSSAMALKIAQAHGQALTNEVESIRITATAAAIAYPGCDNAGPLETVSQGKLSIQYGVCSSLAFARLDEETLGRVHDSKVASLMHKCALLTTPEYEKSYAIGNQPAKVEVVLRNGAALQEAAPDVPWLNAQQVKARFLQEISPLAPAHAGEKMLERCQMLRGPGIANQIFGI